MFNDEPMKNTQLNINYSNANFLVNIFNENNGFNEVIINVDFLYEYITTLF